MAPMVGGDPDARRGHWESVYAAKDATEVSWYESTPEVSLAMLDAVGATPSDAVIDVGAGASRLAAALLHRGFTDVTALDLADDALAAARHDLGPDADRIVWITADLLDWTPGRRYDIWHDRAVFHFLTTADHQRRYLQTAHAALRPDARMVVATFAEDGPRQCSGLPVARYGPEQLVDALTARGRRSLEIVGRRREHHRTPWDSVQAFTWVAVRCLPDPIR